MIKDVVYIGRDNANEWVLDIDGIAIDHRTITRAEIVFTDGISIDSNDHPSWFDFTNQNRMIVRLGSAGLQESSRNANLTIWFAGSINGFRWDDTILVDVIANS